MKATILYSFARIGVFVLIALALMLLHFDVYLSLIAAAILALLISYLAFGRLRRGVAESIVRRRASTEHDEDADLEDALLDGASTDARPVRLNNASVVSAKRRQAALDDEEE